MSLSEYDQRQYTHMRATLQRYHDRKMTLPELLEALNNFYQCLESPDAGWKNEWEHAAKMLDDYWMTFAGEGREGIDTHTSDDFVPLVSTLGRLVDQQGQSSD